ncbi:copine-3-like [Hydractinia symbiolongicarpus]|uniref:copine-3-like n=1 Tax=Hydractinia symbiolongicarpus TaxID=13093 RepID=UPI00254BBD35|nr:copine-3-like [Hydractinia symbiolongicarpus]
MAQFGVPVQNTMVTRVSLSFSCKGLLKQDLTSKSDPIVQVMMDYGGRWKEIGRTERIKNNSNPEFTESIDLDYRFEEVQKMKILVYDVDNATESLGDDDFLGRLECNLAHIVSARTYTKELLFREGVNAGTISITAEEIGSSNVEVTLQFEGQHLDKKDFMSLSDPYLEILKDRGDGTFVAVHRTPHIDNTLNPKWKPFSISLQKLCGNNYDLKLKVACFDHDDDGSHDLIGEFYTTVTEMLKAETLKLQWDCINPKKQKKKKSYKNSGVILLNSIKVCKISSFLDFIMGGCQINFTVGIDFTASNGNPSQSNSLHYLNPHAPNEYVKALVAVGEVCQDYDTDKMFPALGFGCKIPPHGQVSFEFPLNFNPTNPYCQGIPGIVAAYQNCIRQVQLYGPTNVAPIINHVAKFAYSMIQNQEHTASNYFILLLITDGVISDMDDTVSAIVNASYLPMSLIIVGVGGADFAQMDFLDCDQGKLRANNGREALRDIVQFVPFRDFRQVGIDFTASNGNPSQSNSLHYLNPHAPNEYVKALVAVGEVCQDYDTDKMFPALGFGCKIPPHGQVSFEFPLNFNPTNPYCQGIPGIVAAYQNCIRQVQLYGPTNVAPIINHVAKFAYSMIQNQEHTASNYFILLLITDGVISDMDDTVSAIVNASYLPMSLIIVGVGGADFAQMDERIILRANNGREALRDIVQFVPFRDFRQVPPTELAKAVLAEVPKQVTDFYRIKGIQPNTPPPIPNMQMPTVS